MPKPLEPGRRELGVAHRVLDVLVAEVGLQAASVDAPVGQVKPAGVPQHVRMDREVEAWPQRRAGRSTCGSPRCVNGAPRSEVKMKRRLRLLLALEPAQGPQLASRQRMDAWRAALGSIDVQSAVSEIH